MNINDKYQYQSKNQTLEVPSPTNKRLKSLGRVGTSLSSMPTIKIKG